MSLEAIWAAYRDGIAPVQLRSKAATPEELFYVAVMSDRAGDASGAVHLAQQAAKLDPGNAVYAEAVRYLAAAGHTEVYAEASAFTAFATGGGNVGLYRCTHEALRAQYADHRPARLLDIGTGEGHGLLPALTPDVGHVDVIEPSRQRLGVLTAELTRRGISHTAHAMTVQRFMTEQPNGSWDLVQETFALLTLTRQDRLSLLQWLRPRTTRLVLAEFDVPDLGVGLEPRWFHYLIERYDRGIREYHADRDLVAQGFLIPVLLGVLGDDNHTRHHEQPVRLWEQDLAACGFAPAQSRPLYDYWWAPAYAITAG